VKKAWLLLFLILVLQFLLRVPFLYEPLNLDEATYVQISARMSQGELLYRDMVDIKPPGLFYIFMLIGKDPFLMRLMTALFGLLTTFCVFLVGRKLADDRLGLAAAFLYAVFSGGVFIEGAQSNPETFMVLPLLLALLAFISGPPFWAGLLSGIAFLIKQTAAFNFLALLLLALFAKKVRPVLTIILGFVICPLILVGYYFSRGALAEFVNTLFFYSLGMVKPSLVSFLVKTALLFFFESSVLWILAIAGSVFIIRTKKDEKLWLLLIWSIFSLIGVYAAGYALGHYYIQVIPALCLLGAVAMVKWKEFDLAKSTQSIFLVLLTALGLFIIANEYEFYFKYTPDQIANERYGTPINSIARKIGLQIKERTKPGDRVFGISSVVAYSGRSSLTKYYLPVRGGRSEVWFLGRLVYAHDFNIKRDPELVQKVDEDFYRNLSDPRTRYWAVNLKDNYSPLDTNYRLQKYGYVLDNELSDVPDNILVFRRK